MLNSEFVDLLACPETKQPLRLADREVVNVVNAAIERGEVVNRGMRKVARCVETLLVREDGKVAYPVWDGIPTLLIDEGIPLEGFLRG